jgi:hypothetical protein
VLVIVHLTDMCCPAGRGGSSSRDSAPGPRGSRSAPRSARRARLDDEVNALQRRLKALDAQWRADRGRLDEELRALDRARTEQRKELQRELRDTAAALRDEIRALREAPS